MVRYMDYGLAFDARDAAYTQALQSGIKNYYGREKARTNAQLPGYNASTNTYSDFAGLTKGVNYRNEQAGKNAMYANMMRGNMMSKLAAADPARAAKLGLTVPEEYFSPVNLSGGSAARPQYGLSYGTDPGYMPQVAAPAPGNNPLPPPAGMPPGARRGQVPQRPGDPEHLASGFSRGPNGEISGLSFQDAPGAPMQRAARKDGGFELSNDFNFNSPFVQQYMPELYSTVRPDIERFKNRYE